MEQEGFEVDEADDYEPPPHVVARLGGWVLRLGRTLLGKHSGWRWSWVGLVLFETFLYLNLVPILTRHLPPRFQADSRWLWSRDFRLIEAAWHDRGRFLRLALYDGLWAAILAPLYEEILFRGVPILLARYLESRLRPAQGRAAVFVIAATSTLLFAWMHHRVIGALPVPQLLFGGLAWISAWRWGLRYSTLLHILVNLLLFGGLIVRLHAMFH